MTPDRSRAFDAAMLRSEFREAVPSGDCGAYIGWLEDQVLKLRKSLRHAGESIGRVEQRYTEESFE